MANKLKWTHQLTSELTPSTNQSLAESSSQAHAPSSLAMNRSQFFALCAGVLALTTASPVDPTKSNDATPASGCTVGHAVTLCREKQIRCPRDSRCTPRSEQPGLRAYCCPISPKPVVRSRQRLQQDQLSRMRASQENAQWQEFLNQQNVNAQFASQFAQSNELELAQSNQMPQMMSSQGRMSSGEIAAMYQQAMMGQGQSQMGQLTAQPYLPQQNSNQVQMSAPMQLPQLPPSPPNYSNDLSSSKEIIANPIRSQPPYGMPTASAYPYGQYQSQGVMPQFSQNGRLPSSQGLQNGGFPSNQALSSNGLQSSHASAYAGMNFPQQSMSGFPNTSPQSQMVPQPIDPNNYPPQMAQTYPGATFGQPVATPYPSVTPYPSATPYQSVTPYPSTPTYSGQNAAQAAFQQQIMQGRGPVPSVPGYPSGQGALGSSVPAPMLMSQQQMEHSQMGQQMPQFHQQSQMGHQMPQFPQQSQMGQQIPQFPQQQTQLPSFNTSPYQAMGGYPGMPGVSQMPYSSQTQSNSPVQPSFPRQLNGRYNYLTATVNAFPSSPMNTMRGMGSVSSGQTDKSLGKPSGKGYPMPGYLGMPRRDPSSLIPNSVSGIPEPQLVERSPLMEDSAERGHIKLPKSVKGDSVMDALLSQVQRLHAVSYSRTDCVRCRTAEALLERAYSIPLTVFHLDKLPKGGDLLEFLGTITGSNEVPQIFICGYYIGGYDHVLAYHDSGELEKFVSKCFQKKKTSTTIKTIKT